MSWQAKPRYIEHHHATIERLVNTLPLSYLLPPCLGELFNSLNNYNSRLRGYALTESFNIIRYGKGTQTTPSHRYKCIFHGSSTQNHRKLKDSIERDKKGKITSKRQKDATHVR